MTTMRDVARVAGVSAKTVSRVFNDDPHVTPETRERVQWAMKKLHFVPNTLARSFRTGAADVVGVAVPDIADPFFATMTSSIEEEMVTRGLAVVVTSLGSDPSREPQTLETLLRRQLSGLIVASISRDHAFLATWSQRTPMVFVDRAAKGVDIPSVIEDDLAGAKAAVNHLIRHGHRRIGFVGVSTYITTTHRRLDGYKAALREHGIAVEPDQILVAGASPQHAAEDLVTRLGRPDPPTAVFSATILCSMTVVRALHRIDRRDVAMVGFGDFPMAEALTPAVSVIDQDPANLGRVAVERLFAPTSGSRTPPRRKTVLPVTLIPRGSGELAPPS